MANQPNKPQQQQNAGAKQNPQQQHRQGDANQADRGTQARPTDPGRGGDPSQRH